MENVKYNVVNRETLVPVGIGVSVAIFLISSSVYGASKITTIENNVLNNEEDIQRLSDRQIPRSEVQLRLESIRGQVVTTNNKLDKLLERFSIE